MVKENERDGDDDLSFFVRVDFLHFSFGFGIVLKVAWLVVSIRLLARLLEFFFSPISNLLRRTVSFSLSAPTSTFCSL